MDKLYRLPNDAETRIVTKNVCRKRDDMFAGGLYFGMLSMCFALLFAIIGGSLGAYTKEYAWIITVILIDVAICSTTGALRSGKESRLYKTLEFSVCKGKIIGKKRRNCWSDSICIEFENGMTKKFSVFGHDFRSGDTVLVSLANTEYANFDKWSVVHKYLVILGKAQFAYSVFAKDTNTVSPLRKS